VSAAIYARCGAASEIAPPRALRAGFGTRRLASAHQRVIVRHHDRRGEARAFSRPRAPQIRPVVKAREEDDFLSDKALRRQRGTPPAGRSLRFTSRRLETADVRAFVAQIPPPCALRDRV
jgi:hypothetical protein